jgi:heme iron utilization protein
MISSVAREKDDPASDARAWLLTTASGVLSTLSIDPATSGWPFGSVVPFALTASGAPVILTATIAQHTRNLDGDQRASLLVQQPGTEASGDPQAGWRLTLLGRMRRVAEPEIALTHARYVERVPDAESYLETHDFIYWAMDLVRIRYIGGFGKICWLDPKDVLRDPDGAGIGGASSGIIAHMNADHADTLLNLCEAFRGFRPADARMVSVDRAGFVVRTQQPDTLVHFSFGREIGAADARAAFVDLAKQARAKLGAGK